jgi:major vault protein
MHAEEQQRGVRQNANELLLPPGEYAYLQNSTKGDISVAVGPISVTVGAQEYPVVWNEDTKQFLKVQVDDSRCFSPLAREGEYIVLSNPDAENTTPIEAKQAAPPELLMGKKVNIPGPATFALWPRQEAEVVKGHQLRSNEYLRIRVYDQKAAQKYWKDAIVEGSSESGAEVTSLLGIEPKDLTLGKEFVVRGTDVSFFIPPSGVEVIAEGKGQYVRKALTLERLEYCILVGEDGQKDFQRGPKVVFPAPDQRFYKDKDGNAKFPPVELTPISGVHIKVIEPYEENGRQYKEGEELFLTGEETPIYFPRKEHSLLQYEGKARHFATAIPAGEGRYVMDRLTGKIRMVKGETNLLPDPRKEVMVRRPLTQEECDLWFPGDAEVANYHITLRAAAQEAGTRQVTDEDYSNKAVDGVSVTAALADVQSYAASTFTLASNVAADAFDRKMTYTPPRQITLDTKHQGVPAINVPTGVAVMVVSKTGDRRVVPGPETVLLEYDETLEMLRLSTGKPKNTDNLLKTVYLRHKNVQIGDIFAAETRDHIHVEIKVSLRGSFGGDNQLWFEEENFVKLACDHVRSIVKARVRRFTIEELHNRVEEIVRDAVLGEKVEGSPRTGLSFEGNGFRIDECEVLKLDIKDTRIAQLIDEAQHFVVESNIQMGQAQKSYEDQLRREEMVRGELVAKEETAKFRSDIGIAQIEREMKMETKKSAQSSEAVTQARQLAELQQETKNFIQEAELSRKAREAQVAQTIQQQKDALSQAMITAETEAAVKRFEAAGGTFAEAVTMLGNQEVLARVAEASSVQRLIGGKSLPDVFSALFENTSLDGLFKQVEEKATSNGNHKPAARPRA